MNIILIGGGGFIGKNLYQYFNIENNRIIVLARQAKSTKNYYSLPDIGWDKIISMLAKYENWVVIDLAYASVPNTSFADPIKDFSDNLYLINKTLEAMLKLSIRKYIYISSGGTVYGNTGLDVIPESFPNFPLSPYGITKMACERYINMYRELYGLKSVIVRPSNVYGPEQIPFRGQGLISTILGLVYKGESVKIFGAGDVVRDYIYIDDFCTALDDIIKYSKVGEIYNVGAGKGNSIMEIVNVAYNVVQSDGYKITIEHLPSRPFDVKKNVLSHEKLSYLNNWVPKINLLQGITKTWEWVKNYMAQPSH